MKHIQFVSNHPATPAMATSVLEIQRNIEILGDLVAVIGDVLDVSQSAIDFFTGLNINFFTGLKASE